MSQPNSDDDLRDIFESVKTIAVVGASPKPERPSNYVMAYLQSKGYRAIPVNPGVAGQTINGEECRASLSEIGEPVDMVDVFRQSDALPGIVEEAIAIGAKVLWTQLGVQHESAAARARAAGLKVVVNRCPKIEYPRVMGR